MTLRPATVQRTDQQALGGGRTGAVPILCADDFAISDGVCRAIEQLAAARRLSATGAIVTLPRWSGDAQRLARLQPMIAVGLHLNLTLGRPLGAMPVIAPHGALPTIGRLTAVSVSGRIDRSEIAAEVGRQLAAFAAATGFEPEFVDGHQHVHALPGVRAGFVSALIERYGSAETKPLVRDPAESVSTIVRRRASIGKSAIISGLSTGFGSLVRGAGFKTNDSFAGVSPFDTRRPFAGELAAFMRAPGSCHLIMCHPGFPDAELAALDPVLERRRQEFDALMAWPDLPDAIWHPDRTTGQASPNWPGTR